MVEGSGGFLYCAGDMTDSETTDFRVRKHPVLPVGSGRDVGFYWAGKALKGRAGETVSSALFANGIRVFGHHPKDGTPQGIFCANGQCSQCMVIADGLPVKSCMEPVREGMRVEPVEGLPRLPDAPPAPAFSEIPEEHVECLIIGGGPSGLSAAIELGKLGVRALLIDDKDRLGGKLVLQTHKFFGSMADCYAGTRGTDIGALLADEVAKLPGVEVRLGTNAVGVFSDKKVGLVTGGSEYTLVRPDALLIATGAREKSLIFKGNTLPGVYGAGAFQTLVNRDLVKPADRLFIVGGGNVGLIAGYHALQAGIDVVGLVEALPECGGYKVHKDKLIRFGVPIHTSHTVISANGADSVESVTIAKLDERWKPVPGSERSFGCDTILIAVGLDPVDEFYKKARDFGMRAFAAGDAREIAEASAAMFSGKIRGLEIAHALGREAPEIPEHWTETERTLKSKPGKTGAERIPDKEEGVFPVFHCSQDIPCNPCISVCRQKAISVGDDIRNTPQYLGFESGKPCTGCGLCVAVCPGLAITVVDYRKDPDLPTVTIAHEFALETVGKGDRIEVFDTVGRPLGMGTVSKVILVKKNKTLQVKLEVPKDIARLVAGIRVQPESVAEPLNESISRLSEDSVVCRCERVTVAEIRRQIQAGSRDINQIKAMTRAGMGACGSKTCNTLIKRIFAEEGVPKDEITDNVDRPLFVEVPMGVFCGGGHGAAVPEGGGK